MGTPKELTENLKRNLKVKKLEIDLFRVIKKDLQGVFLFYQNEQLFKNSEGSDGIKLGRYSYTKNRSKGKIRGKPFTMVDSGELKRKMFIKVHYRHITLGSNRSDPSADELKNSVTKLGFSKFQTDQWFGLTDKSMKAINRRFLTKYIRQWTKAQGMKTPRTLGISGLS